MSNNIVHPDFNPFRKENENARDLQGYAKAMAELLNEYRPLIRDASTEEEKQSLRDALDEAIEALKVAYNVDSYPDSGCLY